MNRSKTEFSNEDFQHGGVKMSKLTWNIVHECDDEEGNPVQWATEINHPKYGKISAKRWVTTHLMIIRCTLL